MDTELRRVQVLFNQLEAPETLEFDDLVGLGVSMAVQRMRTMQQRRLRLQHNAWLVAQNPRDFRAIRDDPDNRHREASFHTQLLFKAMWEAADVLTTRQIEVWHDPQGRFMTCDAPVLVPFRHNVGLSLTASPYIIWPVGPHRTVALSNDPQGEKAVIRKASGKLVGMVRQGVEQGRERMIFASEEQRERLPQGKKFRRRAQSAAAVLRPFAKRRVRSTPSVLRRVSRHLRGRPRRCALQSGLALTSPRHVVARMTSQLWVGPPPTSGLVRSALGPTVTCTSCQTVRKRGIGAVAAAEQNRHNSDCHRRGPAKTAGRRGTP